MDNFWGGDALCVSLAGPNGDRGDGAVAFSGRLCGDDLRAPIRRVPAGFYFTDKLPRRARAFLAAVNRTIVLAIALFFAVAATDAAVRDFYSGAASEILLWPRYFFWTPATLSLWLFAFYAALRLVAAGKRADGAGG